MNEEVSEPGIRTVLVTGGAGYVGAVLVPKLLGAGYRVRVLDLFWYGDDVLEPHPDLEVFRGDIRDQALLKRGLSGCDAVIHLACVSNDPSFELDPALGRSINYDAFGPLVDIAKGSGVSRFIYASSSSVYGLKDEPEITEDSPPEPLTDYSKYKWLCEKVLKDKHEPGFTTVVLRPATVCGYSPRQRLDLTVNILTNHAISSGRMQVFGGSQKRPNIHIADITNLYVDTLRYPSELIDEEVFNAGYQNLTILEVAELVKSVLDDSEIEINVVPTDDLRSYHISSEKIKRVLGYEPTRTIEDAIRDLANAFRGGKIPNSLTDPRYYNIKTMQSVRLS